MSRKTTDPAKIRLEINSNIFEAELPWDVSFQDLIDVFVGLCSAATYGDKTDLYRRIYDSLDEQYASDEEYERRKQECPEMFK